MTDKCDEWDIDIAKLKKHMSADHWSVTVAVNGENVVTIESNCLCGRELSEADESAVRMAAHHLLGFIGDPIPASPEPAAQDEANR